MNTSPTKSVVSSGKACALIQYMPERIKRAAVELNINPVLRINCIDHYDEDDVQRIGDYLRQERGQKL